MSIVKILVGEFADALESKGAQFTQGYLWYCHQEINQYGRIGESFNYIHTSVRYR
jgi:hypothetical protein